MEFGSGASVMKLQASITHIFGNHFLTVILAENYSQAIADDFGSAFLESPAGPRDDFGSLFHYFRECGL